MVLTGKRTCVVKYPRRSLRSGIGIRNHYKNHRCYSFSLYSFNFGILFIFVVNYFVSLNYFRWNWFSLNFLEKFKFCKQPYSLHSSVAIWSFTTKVPSWMNSTFLKLNLTVQLVLTGKVDLEEPSLQKNVPSSRECRLFLGFSSKTQIGSLPWWFLRLLKILSGWVMGEILIPSSLSRNWSQRIVEDRKINNRQSAVKYAFTGSTTWCSRIWVFSCKYIESLKWT